MEWGLADVDLKKALEEPGIALEGAQDRVAKNGRAIQQEKVARHEGWKTLDAAMGLLIRGEIVGAEGVGEGCGLSKAQGHAFAGNGIDGSGGIADEGDVAVGDAAEFAAEGDGTSGGAFGLGGGEVLLQSGEVI